MGSPEAHRGGARPSGPVHVGGATTLAPNDDNGTGGSCVCDARKKAPCTPVASGRVDAGDAACQGRSLRRGTSSWSSLKAVDRLGNGTNRKTEGVFWKESK